MNNCLTFIFYQQFYDKMDLRLFFLCDDMVHCFKQYSDTIASV